MKDRVKSGAVSTVLINQDNVEIDNSEDVVLIDINEAIRKGLVKDLKGNFNGFYLKIPEKTNFELAYKANGNLNERSRIIVGKNSKLSLIEEREGSSSSNGQIDILLDENSVCNYVELQNLDLNSNLDLKRNVICGKNSKFTREVMHLGSRNSKIITDVNIDEDSVVNNVEVFFENNEQNFEINTNLIHKGNNSKGNVLINGILTDKAFCNSHGILKVDDKIKGVNTYLGEHVLLLSKEAKARAIPALEVKTNDVQASHAASVTQIDGDQVFYLTTRGIGEKEARKTIANGFLFGILQKISNEYVKEKFNKVFEEKWK